jgi:hypothetical protein
MACGGIMSNIRRFIALQVFAYIWLDNYLLVNQALFC